MFVSSADWIALVGAFFGLGGLVGVGETLRYWGWDSVEIRRLVHAGVGLVVAGSPLLFGGPGPVYVLAVVFVIVNAGAKSQQWWPGIHAARPESWGTVMMPLVLIPALATTWTVGAERAFILQVAFLILALADPLASWAGAAWGRRVWVDESTIVGSGVFLGAAFVLAGTGLFQIADWGFQPSVAGALLLAVVATAIEAICRRGWDNFFVVMGVILVLVPLQEGTIALVSLGGAIAVGIGFGSGAYVARLLNGSGAVGGGLFAASLVALGGWAWALPGFVFFLLSSALSFVTRNESTYQQQDGDTEEGRQLRQVLANGGMAWLLLGVFAGSPGQVGDLHAACYAGFLGAFSAAAADTWATEIGVYSSSRPWSLRTGSRVEAGVSGAVSIGGTVGAILGAGSVGGAAILVDGALGPISWGSAMGVIGAGIVGMTVDSVAGAFFQARYRDPDTGHLTEQPIESDTAPVRGWKGVDNEVVNGIGTTAGALAALLFL